MWKKAAQQLIQGKPAGKVWNELARKDPLAAKAATRINQVVYDAEKLVDNVWHGKPTKTASVPFMVRRCVSFPPMQGNPKSLVLCPRSSPCAFEPDVFSPDVFSCLTR